MTTPLGATNETRTNPDVVGYTPEKTDAIEYIRRVVMLPPDPDGEYTNHFPYTPRLHTYEMMVAGNTGLAYVVLDDTPGPSYTVVHLPSGRLLNAGWAVDSEQFAQRWIEWLLHLADWTGPVPQIRAECLGDVLSLTCAGMLVDPLLDNDSDIFDPGAQPLLATIEAEVSEGSAQ